MLWSYIIIGMLLPSLGKYQVCYNTCYIYTACIRTPVNFVPIYLKLYLA